MHKTIFQKIAVTAASVLVGVAGMEVKPIQATTAFWDLQFFDDSGTQVGSGEFSYNTDTLTFIPTSYLADSGFYVSTGLESFSANIDGVEWDDSFSYSKWWTPSDPVGTFGNYYSRDGEPRISASWFSSEDSFQRTRTLVLDDDISGNRRWSQTVLDDPQGYIEGSGNWTAILSRVDMPDLGFSVYTDRSAWEAAVSGMGASVTTETFDNDIPNARDIGVQGDILIPVGDGRPEITFDNGIISKAEGNAAFFTNEVQNGLFRGRIDTDNDLIDIIIGEVVGGGEYSEAITWTFPSPVIGFGADWFNIGPGEPLMISGNFDGKQEQTVSLYGKLATAMNEFGGLVGNGSGFLGIVSQGTFSKVTLQSQVPGELYEWEDFQVDNLSLATAPTTTPVPEPGTILALAAFSLTGLATKKKLTSSKSQLPS